MLNRTWNIRTNGCVMNVICVTNVQIFENLMTYR